MAKCVPRGPSTILIIVVANYIKGILSRDINVLVNESVSISCSANSSTEIQWHFNSPSEYIYTGGGFKVPYKGRLLLQKNDATGTYILKIPDVRPEDAGEYFCSEEKSGRRIDTTHLTVLYSSPSCHSNILTEESANTCNLDLDVMTFSCATSYKGKPPKLTWKMSRGNTPLNSSVCNYEANRVNCSLNLPFDSFFDITEFICQATSNGIPYSCSSGVVKTQCICVWWIVIPICVLAIVIVVVGIIVDICIYKRRAKDLQYADEADNSVTKDIPQVNIMTNKRSISGMTVLRKSLFLSRYETSEIEVYNLSTNRLERQFTIPKITAPLDIASKKSSIFIIGRINGTDNSSQIITMKSNGLFVCQWSSGGNDGRLSASKSSIVVCFPDRLMISEFSHEGKPIRVIQLQTENGLSYPWHAMKVSNSKFLVSYGQDMANTHGVCMIGTNGRLVKQCTGWDNKSTREQSQFSVPVCLSKSNRNTFLVADRDHRRIVLLSNKLKFQRTILDSNQLPDIFHPIRLSMEKTKQRLLVAINRCSNRMFLGSRVLILNIDDDGGHGPNKETYRPIQV